MNNTQGDGALVVAIAAILVIIWFLVYITRRGPS